MLDEMLASVRQVMRQIPDEPVNHLYCTAFESTGSKKISTVRFEDPPNSEDESQPQNARKLLETRNSGFRRFSGRKILDGKVIGSVSARCRIRPRGKGTAAQHSGYFQRLNAAVRK